MLKAVSSGIIVKVITDKLEAQNLQLIWTLLITLGSLATVYLALTALEKYYPRFRSDIERSNLWMKDEKERLAERFHAVIETQTSLAISFENKFTSYCQEICNAGQYTEIQLDLCMTYLSQAVYYHTEAKNNYYKSIYFEKPDVKAKALYDLIGFAFLHVSLETNINSCVRINNLITSLLGESTTENREENNDGQPNESQPKKAKTGETVEQLSATQKDDQKTLLVNKTFTREFQSLSSAFKEAKYDDNLLDLRKTICIVESRFAEFYSMVKKTREVSEK